MSGIKPLPLTEFYRALHARGLSTELLAEQLGVAGGTLRRKIGGLARRQGPVWRGFLDLLTERERALLAEVEQCSAWNISQAAKRPRLGFEVQAALRARAHRSPALSHE